MHGLVLRQRLPLEEVPLHTYISDSVPCYLENFVQIALQLPGLLERADAVTRDPAIGCDRETVIEQFTALQHDLHTSWLAEARTFEIPCPEAIPKDIESPPRRLYLTPSGSLVALQFDSFLIGLSYSFYWTCMLVLRSTLEELLASSSGNDIIPVTGCLSNETASAISDLLCRTIPFLLDTAGGLTSQAIAVRAPLFFLVRYYERTKDYDRLEWCRRAETSVRERVPFLQWDAMLPIAFRTINWLAP